MIHPSDRLDPAKFEEEVRFTSWIANGKKRQVLYHDGDDSVPLGLFIEYVFVFLSCS